MIRRLAQPRVSPLVILTIAVLSCVVVFGCVESTGRGTITKNSEEELDTIPPSLFIAKASASAAQASSDYITAGTALSAMSRWNKAKRQLLISGIYGNEIDVKFFCALAFYLYADDLSSEEGVNIYESVKDDVRVKTALMYSVHSAIGRRKENPPASALAIEDLNNQYYPISVQTSSMTPLKIESSPFDQKTTMDVGISQ